MADAAWVIRNAEVLFPDGKARVFAQINVYESGLLVDPTTRTAISPSGYTLVRTSE